MSTCAGGQQLAWQTSLRTDTDPQSAVVLPRVGRQNPRSESYASARHGSASGRGFLFSFLAPHDAEHLAPQRVTSRAVHGDQGFTISPDACLTWTRAAGWAGELSYSALFSSFAGHASMGPGNCSQENKFIC